MSNASESNEANLPSDPRANNASSSSNASDTTVNMMLAKSLIPNPSSYTTSLEYIEERTIAPPNAIEAMLSNLTREFKIPKTSSISQFFRCNFCEKLAKPPVVSCENGHLFCLSCSQSIASCCVTVHSIIGSKMCGTYFNPFVFDLLNYVYSHSYFSCYYSPIGCEEKLFVDEMESHITSECKYRPHVKCGYLCCEKIILAQTQLVPHLTGIHGVKCVKNAPAYRCHIPPEKLFSIFPTDDSSRFCALILFIEGLYFGFYIQRLGVSFAMWITCLSDNEEIHGRKIDFRVTTGKIFGTSTYEGLVHERDKEISKILEENSCSIIAQSFIEKNSIVRSTKGAQKSYVEIDIQLYNYKETGVNNTG